MNKYYNINAILSAPLKTVSFTLCTEQNYGHMVIDPSGRSNIVDDNDFEHLDLAIAVYFHLAEIYIQQYHQAQDNNSSDFDVLDNICTFLRNQGSDGKNAMKFIEKGMQDKDDALLRRGLFTTFVHNISVTIAISPCDKTLEDVSVLYFDPMRCSEDFAKLSETACYQIEFEQCDSDSELIEEWNTHLITPYYIGELLDKYLSTPIDEIPFFDNFGSCLQQHAAKMLCYQHIQFKDDLTFLDEGTPYQRFLDWALENDEIDNDTYMAVRNCFESKIYDCGIIEMISNLNAHYNLVQITYCNPTQNCEPSDWNFFYNPN